MSSEDEKSTDAPSEFVKPKKRKNGLPDFTACFDKILDLANSGKNLEFKATVKSSRGLHNGTSKRRSQYIGVLRNGQRWQVLINVGKKKKYVGTFSDEKEAAVVHDFFCIGLNGVGAKTNFTYNCE